MKEYRGEKTLYRSRDGMILGVFRGMADYLEFPVFWLRLLGLILIPVSFTTIVLFYIIAALLMKPEPVLPLESDSDREFYDSFVSSRKMAIQRLKRTYDNLDRRIRRLESIVTSRDFNWEHRLNSDQ